MTSRDMLKKEKELAYRGYLDVGAGYAVIPNGAPNTQDIGGFTATIKAYPLGRWYAPLKTVTKADEIKALLANATKPDNLLEKQKQLDVAKKELETARKGLKNASTDTFADETRKVQAAEEEYKLAETELDKAVATDRALQGSSVDAELYQFKKDHPCRSKDQDDQDKPQDDQDKPQDEAANDQGKECTLQRRLKPNIHRFFLFYGRSIGGYGSAVKGEVNSIGIGYDITPQFGLIMGRAWYDVSSPTAANNRNDTKDAIMFGVQINLNSFKSLRDVVGVE